MRQTIGEQENELGFEVERRKSRRHPPVTISDFDFADDIALLAERIVQAQELLYRLETEAAKVGLHLNANEVAHFQNLGEVIVGGDLNARVGDLKDHVVDDGLIGSHVLPDNYDYDHPLPVTIWTQDKMYNFWLNTFFVRGDITELRNREIPHLQTCNEKWGSNGGCCATNFITDRLAPGCRTVVLRLRKDQIDKDKSNKLFLPNIKGYSN
ncbi:hypothetical protein Bbelb_109490 [Branchiostoma belcheri]|nr:hypothetical protein Bbelb_109490 [Branchiostoma belcheri]